MSAAPQPHASPRHDSAAPASTADAGASPGKTLDLPRHEEPSAREQRRAEVAAERLRWAWNFDDPTLPPRLARVPAEEIPAGGVVELLKTQLRLWSVQFRGFLRRVAFALTSGRRAPAPFQAYDELFADGDRPALATRWKTDEEFAMQRLNGLWPDMISRCTALPAGFALTDDMVAGLLPPGETLRGMIDQGLVYVVDQSILTGYPRVKDHVTAAPTTLFFTDRARGRLMPLAVKLTPEADAPVFTPNDAPGLWLAVKAFVNNADLLVHVAARHFLRMHFAMEAFYVSMLRHLSRRHPIRAFVRPHFYLHLFADKNVRDMILKDTDWWIIRRAWPSWSFRDLDVPRDFQGRGVDDPEKLPNFHFREESLALWDTYRSYVGGIVDSVYPSDADVAGDDELQDWMRELRDPRFGGLRDVPVDPDGRMTRREQLTLLLTCMLFNVTTRHNHNTNAGRQYYAYTPNTPLTLTLPLPKSKDVDVPEATLSAAMPAPSVAAKVIADIESVQNLPGTFNLLGRYSPDFLAGHPAARAHVEAFQARLVALEAEMRQRDATRAVPYPYLYPTLTANSIWS